MERRHAGCLPAVLSSVVETLGKQNPSLLPPGAHMAAKGEWELDTSPAPIIEREEITYNPTGRIVLACAADWDMPPHGDSSPRSLLSRLRQCLCIDRERMDMFKLVFQEEREELERHFQCTERRQLLYRGDCMQTLPIMQCVVDELKDDIAEARSDLQTVEGIAADVDEFTIQLIKEYEELDFELCLLEHMVPAASRPSEVTTIQTPRGAGNGSEEAVDLGVKVRLEIIDRVVSAKEREHRRQLSMSVTENMRKELVEVGNSIFPDSLNSHPFLWDQLLPTSGPVAPPNTPTPMREIQGSAFPEQISTVCERQTTHACQQSISCTQQDETTAERVLVKDISSADSQFSAAVIVALTASVETPSAVSELPGTLVPRKPSEIRRGRGCYRRLNPLLIQRCADSCRHGDPTFVYSADERSPSRSSTRMCSLEEEGGTLCPLRCNSLSHTSVSARTSLNPHSSRVKTTKR